MAKKVTLAKRNNTQTGKLGEDLAADFLVKKGYEILERNAKGGRVEIDIVAKQADKLIFVEVKTRHNNFFGNPEEAVNSTKENNIARAASIIRTRLGHEVEIRFDIIAITLHPTLEIYHIEDAFFPGLD